MKKAIVAVIIILAAGIGGYFVYTSLYQKQEERLAEKERELREIQETFVPLRFRIVERSAATMKVEIRFYSIIVDNIESIDMEVFSVGKEVCEPYTFELSGEELFIDCMKIPNGGLLPFAPETVWVFPYRVFTDTIAPDNAIALYTRYTGGNTFPLIFDSLDLGAEDKERLSSLFAGIQNADTGNALHDMNTIARFRVDRWYDLVVHIKTGALEFISE
jgi:hypothetical protein